MIDRPFLGGGQITLLSLARHLDRETFDVSVCSGEGGPLVDELKKGAIAHFPVTFRKRLSFKTVRDIASLLEANRIDILHTHGGIAGFYGRWAARRCRTPVIIHTLHGIHYLHYRNYFLKWAYIWLERKFSGFADAVVFVSESDLEKGKRLRLVPENKMRVIKNGVDFSVYRKDTEPAFSLREALFGTGMSVPIIGTIARLHRQKGIIYLIKAAEEILRVFPEVRIVVVGGGPLGKKLGLEINKRGLRGRFFLLGERRDAPELLRLFDIFILPSLWEGLPYVLVEAAFSGKPIIATEVDGIKEVLRNKETALLIPPKNPAALAEAVLLLLKEREFARRLGERAREEIPARFTLARMVEETQRLYLDKMGI